MTTSSVGAVVIGRNEGDRLRVCLESVLPHVNTTVYVDSGSVDGSMALATRLGAHTLELSSSIPFTAARARNVGWKRILELNPGIQYIQFVDGDCTLAESWINAAVAALAVQPETAVICGHVREDRLDRNIYHRLAGMEWDTPVGVAQCCGGIALVRASALMQVNGYNETVVAAEDDELCVRLRLKNWVVLRIAPDMATHDVRMEHFGQWWKRATRSGHGFAQVFAMHGNPPMYYFRRELYRTLLWGGVLPVLAIALAIPTCGWSVIIAIILYGASLWRTYLGRRRNGDAARDAGLYAVFATVSKFPAMIGVLRFWKRRICSQPFTLIEHKSHDDGLEPRR